MKEFKEDYCEIVSKQFKYHKHLCQLQYIGKSVKPKQPPLEYKDYSHMFYDRSDLEVLDLSSWDMSKVEDMKFMFAGCINLKEIKGIKKWDLSSLKNYSYMFFECDTFIKNNIHKLNDKLFPENMSKWVDSSGAIIFYDNTQFILEEFDSNIIGGGYLKYIGESTKPTQPIGLYNYVNMFKDRDDLEIIDLSDWDSSQISNIVGMFSGVDWHKLIGTDNWDFSKIRQLKRPEYYDKEIVIPNKDGNTIKIEPIYKEEDKTEVEIVDKSYIRLEDFSGVLKVDNTNNCINDYLSVGDIISIKYKFKNDYNFYDMVEDNFYRIIEVINICKIEKIINNDEIYVEVLSENSHFGTNKNIIISKKDIVQKPSYIHRIIDNVDDLVRILSEVKNANTNIKIKTWIYDKSINLTDFSIVIDRDQSVVLDCGLDNCTVSVRELVDSLENISSINVRILDVYWNIKSVIISEDLLSNGITERVYLNVILK